MPRTRKRKSRRSSRLVAKLAARVLDEGYLPTVKEILSLAGSVVSQGRGKRQLPKKARRGKGKGKK